MVLQTSNGLRSTGQHKAPLNLDWVEMTCWWLELMKNTGHSSHQGTQQCVIEVFEYKPTNQQGCNRAAEHVCSVGAQYVALTPKR